MIKRRAFTLIELSVSMTAGSALLIMAIGLLHQSMSLASTARERSDHQRTLNRLAQEFRRDVHRAAQCTTTSTDRMQLRMPDASEITYVVSDNRVTRRQPRDGGPDRRESFEFGSSATATFESLTEPNRAVLVVVDRPHPSIDRTRIDRKVAAVVGRLASHENSEVSP